MNGARIKLATHSAKLTFIFASELTKHILQEMHVACEALSRFEPSIINLLSNT